MSLSQPKDSAERLHESLVARQGKLLAAISKAVAPELQREVQLLTRKLKLAREQRDDWREAAMRYRKQILGKDEA